MPDKPISKLSTFKFYLFFLLFVALLGAVIYAISLGTNQSDNSANNQLFHYHALVLDNTAGDTQAKTLEADIAYDATTASCTTGGSNACGTGIDIKGLHQPDGSYTSFKICNAKRGPVSGFAFVNCTAANGAHHSYSIKLTDKAV